MDRLTERLIFQPASIEDLPDVIAMNCNPDVMRYIRPVGSVEETELAYRNSLQSCIPGQKELYTVRQNKSGDFIGWGVILPLRGYDHIEIGYRLTVPAWGRGYATEIGKELLKIGFDDWGQDHITAVTHQENQASARVLQKVGLKEVGLIAAYDTQCRFFYLKHQDWQRRGLDFSDTRP